MISHFKFKTLLLSAFQIISSFCSGQTYDEALKEYLYGDLNKSINLFTNLIETKQEVSKSYMYRGAANSFLANFNEAKRDLDSSFILDSSNLAILRNAKDAAAYDQRAVVKSFLGDLKGAIKDGDTAIALDSTDKIS